MSKQKYHIELDVSDVEATHAVGHPGQWKNYGTIVASGNTLKELLDDASVDVLDQDGGELAVLPADATWMQQLIVGKYCEFSDVQAK